MPDRNGRMATSLRFDPELHERITTAARERRVSVQWLVERLVTEGLDRLIPADEFSLTRPRQIGDPVQEKNP